MTYTFPAVLLQVRVSWLVQAVQLCQLCCIAVASNSAAPDAVLDAAAARCLQLLTTPSAWGQSEGSPSKDRAGTADCTCSQSAAHEGNLQAEAAAMASSLLAALEAQPLPLLMAARRCTQQHRLLSQQQQQQQQQQQAVAAAGGVNGITMTATGGKQKADAGASPCQCKGFEWCTFEWTDTTADYIHPSLLLICCCPVLLAPQLSIA